MCSLIGKGEFTYFVHPVVDIDYNQARLWVGIVFGMPVGAEFI